ncbi:hypothetical protein [Erythrobacter sp.]|uniref:hypothetical protein n=1 Tax=Erythrobacter sp. TaxID=1042 RepID=UPI003C707319
MRFAAALSALSMVKMSASALWEKRDEAWLRELGENLCRAHTPIVFDWEARLGLEQADGVNGQGEDTGNVRPLPVAEATPPPAQVSPDEPKLDLSPMTTPHGDIAFIALGDTEVAIRNPAVEPLIEVVRGTVKGRGRWQPRFKNWIVKVEDFEEVRCEIGARLAEAKDQRRA